MARQKITLGAGDDQGGETPGDPRKADPGDAELRLVAGERGGPEELAILQLRPRNFDEYVGQQNLMHSLKIAVTAASNRGEPTCSESPRRTPRRVTSYAREAPTPRRGLASGPRVRWGSGG